MLVLGEAVVVVVVVVVLPLLEGARQSGKSVRVLQGGCWVAKSDQASRTPFKPHLPPTPGSARTHNLTSVQQRRPCPGILPQRRTVPTGGRQAQHGVRRGQEGQEVWEGAVVGARGRGVVVVVGGEVGRWGWWGGREGGEEGGELVGEEGRGEELREEVRGEAVFGVYV